MRIGIVIGLFYSHLQYLENVLAEEFSRAHEVRVFTSDRFLAEMGCYERDGSDAAASYAIRRLPAWFHWRNLVFSRGLAREVKAWQPDLLVFIGNGQLFPATLLSTLRRERIPAVCFFSDSRTHYYSVPRLLRPLKRLAFYLSKGWLYQAIIRHSRRAYGVTHDAVEICRPLAARELVFQPLPFNDRIFACDPEAGAAIRAEHGIDPAAMVILTAGRITALKRLDMLVDAHRELVADGVDAHLLIIGRRDGDESAGLIARAGDSPRVRFLPMLSSPELNRYFNAADVAVWPTQAAITIQQGMGTGAYCLLPDDAYSRSLVRLGKGECVRPIDATGYTRALRRAAEQLHELRDERAARAQFAQDHLSQRHLANELLSVP